MFNLLVNAIKFTKKGSITIKLVQIDLKQFTIYVVDTGIGIKQEN